MNGEKREFFEEIRQCALLSGSLLRRLDPEFEFVKKLVEEEVRKLVSEEGWEQIDEDRPWIKSLERGRYILKIGIVHARKGEHVTGADLFFELKDKKVIFVQSKRVGSNRRFAFDRLQLSKLTDLEVQLNLGLVSVTPQTYVQTPFWPIIPFYKVAFYHLIMTNSQTQERFFHISEITFTLGNRKSVSQDEFINMGITQQEFDDMFWGCRIGAPDLKEESKREMLDLYSLITNRMVIWLDVEERR